MQRGEIQCWETRNPHCTDLEDNILIFLLAQYIRVCRRRLLVLLMALCLGCSLFLQFHLCILCSSISLFLILDLLLWLVRH